MKMIGQSSASLRSSGQAQVHRRVPIALVICLRTVTYRTGNYRLWSTLTFAFKYYQLQMLKKLSS